jgi:spermidine/putrescine transport system substrate-binding protein
MPPTNPSNSRPSLNLQSFAARPSLATRRRFLQASAAAVSGVVLSNCARNLTDPKSNAESSQGSSSKTLRIYGWVNYTDEILLKDFETKTGIKVTVDVYDSNEVMLAKMQAGGGNGYSIIYPTDYMVSQMRDLKMLTSLDTARLKGMESLKDQWKSPVYDTNNAHSVPVAWGTTGLIYDPKKVGYEIKGWADLWDNKDALTRRVTLINDVREVMGATLLYLGHSLNTADPKQIKEAYDRLVELKPAIAAFLTNGWEEQLASGDVQIAMAYSTDALNLIQEQPNLRYVIPETGASLWTDTMVIPKTAPNVDAAYQWINYMLTPDTAAQVVNRLKFATPNQVAFDNLAPAVKKNKSLFPSNNVLKKCEGIAPVTAEISKTFDRYWTQLTSA